jgi:hypothetical protein
MARALLVLAAAVFATIAGAELAYRISTQTQSEPINSPWSLNRMEFRTWNGQRWTSWIRDGSFELVPEDRRNWSRHTNTTIAFTGWDGEPWQAKIDGDRFVLARRGDWSAVTRSEEAIRYRDWDGNKQLRTVTQLRR